MPSRSTNSFAPSVMFVPAVRSGADTVPKRFEKSELPALRL